MVKVIVSLIISISFLFETGCGPQSRFQANIDNKNQTASQQPVEPNHVSDAQTQPQPDEANKIDSNTTATETENSPLNAEPQIENVSPATSSNDAVVNNEISHDITQNEITNDQPQTSEPLITQNELSPEINEPLAPLTATSLMVAPLWEAKQFQGKKWTLNLVKSFTQNNFSLLNAKPRDVIKFCPRYSQLNRNQKINFWIYLVSLISEFESRHNPNATYTENFNDSSGHKVVSRGLLQISLESSRAYKCEIKNERDLHEPNLNLDCGLKILTKWVSQDSAIAGNNGKSWIGGARYWAVLRNIPRKKSYLAIQSALLRLPFCR